MATPLVLAGIAAANAEGIADALGGLTAQAVLGALALQGVALVLRVEVWRECSAPWGTPACAAPSSTAAAE